MKLVSRRLEGITSGLVVPAVELGELENLVILAAESGSLEIVMTRNFGKFGSSGLQMGVDNPDIPGIARPTAGWSNDLVSIKVRGFMSETFPILGGWVAGLTLRLESG